VVGSKSAAFRRHHKPVVGIVLIYKIIRLQRFTIYRETSSHIEAVVLSPNQPDLYSYNIERLSQPPTSTPECIMIF
jgi:hypothetical protein